ncbi:MAG: HypC/HybG/HupF family hydrogenase formation chaperone [Rhodobacteraceae bacterium]|nr:HypC/HybG/HupF family hydrogenase formation chaperone [Paracoccaceae bacterium]
MCLSVPVRIVEITGPRARCTALGQERFADLMLLEGESAKVGDYISVHLGYAQRIIPEADALEAYALFGEILERLEKD